MILPILLTLYALFGLTNIGLLYEVSSWAWPSELVRCGLSLALLNRLSVVFPFPIIVLQAVFGGNEFQFDQNALFHNSFSKDP